MRSPTTSSASTTGRYGHHGVDDDRNDGVDVEYDGDDDGVSSNRLGKNATSLSSPPPPFVSLRDRIHKFDTVASNRMESKKLFASPSISIRRKPRSRMAQAREDEEEGGAHGPTIMVETVHSTEESKDYEEREVEFNKDHSLSPPPFNPSYSTKGNVRNEYNIHANGAHVSVKEKENKVPIYYSKNKDQQKKHVHQKQKDRLASPSSSTSTSSWSSSTSSYSTSAATSSSTTSNTRTSSNQHQGLASFTAAIRKTTPKKKRHPHPSSETTQSHPRTPNHKVKREEPMIELEERLKQLQQENQSLVKRNQSLEQTCETLWNDYRTLEAVVEAASSSTNPSNKTENNDNKRNENHKNTTSNSKQSSDTILKKRNRPDNNSNPHPLISIPLQKHVKAVHEASESNSVVTIRKEPFRLMPPEESRVVALAIAREEGRANGTTGARSGIACTRYSEYCHLDTLGTLTGNHVKVMPNANYGGSYSCDDLKNDTTTKDEDDMKKRQVDDAMDLLNSAAFLFAGSSRRQMF